MDGQTSATGDGLTGILVVGGILQRVHAISKDVSLILTCSKEAQIDGQIARRPVGHRCQKPCGSLTTGYDGVLTQLSVEGDGLVEGSGHLGDEVGTLLILHISRRTVGQHLKRSLKGGVHRHLMDARAPGV